MSTGLRLAGDRSIVLTVEYLREARHQGIVAEIARQKFPFPDEEHPDLETIVNTPKQRISVGELNGKELFPDIVVVRRPGQWLSMIATVESAETVNREAALNRWLPYSLRGELLIYVPVGYGGVAHELCRKHHVHAKGIRTWRFRPVWGLEVAEV